MSDLLDRLRGTGRTTRMLEQARKLEAEGKAVYIIAANAEQAAHLRHLLRLDEGQTSIKVECPAPRTFIWETLTLLGAWPNCVVLVDHYAIESRYTRLLRELHRYDEEASDE